jgi:transcriptional regulator with XRE-family HTH domain
MRDDLEFSRMVTVHGFLNDKPNSGYLFASLIGGILYILPDDNKLAVRWVALLHKHSLGIYAVVGVTMSGHMSWKHELGQQIKQKRESAGLTQADLAGQIDLSRQMIGRYEAGEDAPAVDVLVEIARILDIEFQVKGILVKFEQNHKRSKPVRKQLKLEFEKPRRFDGAQIEITPSEGKILITAEIPA